MGLDKLREKINGLDDELLKVFKERMETSLKIVAEKKKKGLPIMDEARERAILEKITNRVGAPLDTYARKLYRDLFALSRAYQGQELYANTDFVKGIEEAIENSEETFNKRATVACAGILGSNTQQACDKMVPMGQIVYVDHFEAVFEAVEQGLCQYGVLPLENSANGSVKEVYRLLEEHNCYIVRATREWICHDILAKPGTKLSEVKAIYSHPQAFGQCSSYLNKLSGVELRPCANTAVAAKLVADSDEKAIAAIAPAKCSALYHLECLASNIQNSDNNYTRFICISKKLEIYPGANKISLATTANNYPGGLGALLSRFSALGLNLTKLESQPLIGHDFEFLFYLDFEASLKDPAVRALLSELHECQDRFSLLGNYIEY